MTPRAKYQIGTATFFIGVIALLLELLGMLGVIPKFIPTRELGMLALILLILAGGVRRRAQKEMTAKPSGPRSTP